MGAPEPLPRDLVGDLSGFGWVENGLMSRSASLSATTGC